MARLKKIKEVEGKDVEKLKPGPKPGPKKARFKFIGKNAGRYDGQEFKPYPEYGTVMVPADEGERPLKAAKGGIIEVTDSKVIANLEKNPYWERVK